MFAVSTAAVQRATPGSLRTESEKELRRDRMVLLIVATVLTAVTLAVLWLANLEGPGRDIDPDRFWLLP